MLKKVVVGLFCFVILAVSGVGAYVYTLNWNKHKGMVSKRLSQITGLNATIDGNLKVEYFPTPKFTAGKVSFWKGNDKRNPLIEIDEIVANVELMPLLDSKFNISSMILTRPTFNVTISDKGVLNWSDVGGKGKSKAGNIEVSFKDIKLNNSTISYNNLQNNQQFEIPDISATVSAPSLSGPYKTDGKLIHNKNEIKFSGTVTNKNGTKLNMNISNSASNTKATIDGSIGKNAEGLFSFNTQNIGKVVNIIWPDKKINPIYNEDLYISFKYGNKDGVWKLENFTTKYGENTVGTGTVNVKTVEKRKVADAVFKMNKIDLDIFKNIANDYINDFESEDKNSFDDLSKYGFILNINADSAFYNEAESKNLILALELKDALLSVSHLGLVMPGNTNIKTLGSVDLKTLNYNFNNSLQSDDFRVFASVFGFDVVKLANTENKKSIFKNATADVNIVGNLEQYKVSIPNATFDSTAIKGNIGFIKKEAQTVVLADLELSKIIFDKYIDTIVKGKENPSLQDKFVYQMNLIPVNKDYTVDADISVANSVYNNIPLEGLTLSLSNNSDNLKVNKLTINNIAGTYVDLAFDAENIRTVPTFKELSYNVKSNDLPLFASNIGINLGKKKLFNRKLFATQGVLSGEFNEFYLSSVQKFDDVEFSYTGKVKNDNKVFVDGDLELKSDNFTTLLKDFGFDYSPDIPLTSFIISGKLIGSDNLFELSNINAYLGANKISGKLALDNTENKPKIKGNFDIDKLEVARWFSFDDRILSGISSSNDTFISKPTFIDSKIDYANFKKADFDLKTNIKSLIYDKKNYKDTVLDLSLVDGTLNVSKFDTHYNDSKIYFDFVLDSNRMPSISGNYNLSKIKLPNLGGSVYMIKNGILDINGKFNSLATSKKEFFSNLDSTGQFELDNASIDGFDFDIIKFEFEQADSVNGFEDKIINSLKSGTSVFQTIKGEYNITRGVIVSENMNFLSPVVDINTKFNLNLNDWLSYTTFDAIFHNASFSDILKFKLIGAMNTPSVSVELSDVLQRIGSIEKMSKDILKKEEQKKIDELNNKIKSIEKDINSTLTTISRIHYDVARFKPVSSNSEVLKTYDSNIKLLQETEKTIKDIKNMIFEAKDIASLVNLNNKFLAEDAKLKFISKTLEDNFIIDGKYIFDDIFNKIAWVYNVIQNNSSYYNNITDVYMEQVEFSKSTENPISSEVENKLINSIDIVKNTSEKANDLHAKFRDNYLLMIDTNKVADMKENNDIAKQALHTMFAYAKQYNKDMVESLDLFRDALDIKARDYDDYMVNVPNRIEEIDITKPTSPNVSKINDDTNAVDDELLEDVEKTISQDTDENVAVSTNVIEEKKTEKSEENALVPQANLSMELKKGLSGLLNKFNNDNLNKKQSKLISNVAFSGLSNIIPEPKADVITEDIAEKVEPAIENEKIELAQISIDKSVLPIKEEEAVKKENIITNDELSLSEKLKSSISLALSQIKNIENMIIRESIKNDDANSTSNNQATDDNSTMPNISETMKINPVIALNIGKGFEDATIVPQMNDNVIKMVDSTFKRKDVANIVKSLNKPYNVANTFSRTDNEASLMLVASSSAYDIDTNTRGLTSNIVKNDVKPSVAPKNRYLFPANNDIKTSGISAKSIYRNKLKQNTAPKANKYLFAMNDNVTKYSGDLGQIAFLTVK